MVEIERMFEVRQFFFKKCHSKKDDPSETNNLLESSSQADRKEVAKLLKRKGELRPSIPKVDR